MRSGASFTHPRKVGLGGLGKGWKPSPSGLSAQDVIAYDPNLSNRVLGNSIDWSSLQSFAPCHDEAGLSVVSSE
jgi:hypothetical protein